MDITKFTFLQQHKITELKGWQNQLSVRDELNKLVWLSCCCCRNQPLYLILKCSRLCRTSEQTNTERFLHIGPSWQTLRRVAIQTPKITAMKLCYFSLQVVQQVNKNDYLAISTESVSIIFCKLTFCTTTSTAESISATMATFLLPDFGSGMGQGRLHS